MRIARRLGERADAFLRGARNHVLLLELAARLEDDERHLERPRSCFRSELMCWYALSA